MSDSNVIFELIFVVIASMFLETKLSLFVSFKSSFGTDHTTENIFSFKCFIGINAKIPLSEKIWLAVELLLSNPSFTKKVKAVCL